MTAAAPTVRPSIEFCGVRRCVDAPPFVIGRHGDLVVGDDNRHVHRRFLELRERAGVWALANVGGRLCATVSDDDDRLEASLGPGAVLPLTMTRAVVRFAAGPTRYELTIELPAGPHLVGSPRPGLVDGEHTAGRTSMTPDQLRLVLALAEPALRHGARGAGSLPTSIEAAHRLGWPITKFNRKLDNVCHKLAADGVRGLHGGPGRLAANRRARLVEHALATRLVVRADLDLLDALADGGDG